MKTETIDFSNLFAAHPDLLPLETAAELLGIGRTKKYELPTLLRTLKIGKQYMVLKQDLINFVIQKLSQRGA